MARNISRVVLLGGLLALAAAAGGCRRGSAWTLAPVEGTVTKDGRPQGGIQVIFLPDDADTEGPKSSGITDEAGHYRLRTDNGDDGVVVGKHRAVLHDRNFATKQALHRFPKPRRRKTTERLSPEIAKRVEEPRKKAAEVPRVPSSYGSFNETPLQVEVRPGPQVIDLEVK